VSLEQAYFVSVRTFVPPGVVMIRTAAGFALLFASLQLAAQSNSTAPLPAPQMHSLPGGTLIILPDVERACPIAMHASRGVWDHTIKIREGERELVYPRFGQRISLNLKDSHPARIVAATVRVRGMNGKNRMLLTPAREQQDWNAVTTLKANFNQEQNDGSVSADLRVTGFTAVNSIQLIDVSYSDGTTWRIPHSNVCRVQPDSLMLITER